MIINKILNHNSLPNLANRKHNRIQQNRFAGGEVNFAHYNVGGYNVYINWGIYSIGVNKI